MRRRLFLAFEDEGRGEPDGFEIIYRRTARPLHDDSHGYGPPLFDTDPFTDDKETR